ncbi:GNAT family N-acetyltransferase [Priestia megaterium]|uniref:GNAT family N-acetyltransferase n=1 Tax=Priestia megaterium TaxID=1404 RepID=UPI000D520A64|nr:GNAT family N-acetyltransferase [Priestia megaterium]PVE70252.1 GNAT family N-acetyltransferase [Priestia megaterium]PVE82183.1 GNAT family N-acetyltransferase [Priestia megaterium]PVE86769.1 GNAT family N-acetyltransferase [Priestia megaterium]PVE94307.1 GNAT family N-acetyltransferase [Priestia megaterium]
MTVRLVKGSDYYVISPLINDWWNGRQMSDLLPKLFFDHFKNTSFIVEEEGEIIGFLIGFLSQSYSNEAYIHFVGIHPEYRGKGIGRQLYNQFFDVIKQSGRNIVRCVTSPVNKTSIAYHTKMGFEIEQGNKDNQDKVLFVKYLN